MFRAKIIIFYAKFGDLGDNWDRVALRLELPYLELPDSLICLFTVQLLWGSTVIKGTGIVYS